MKTRYHQWSLLQVLGAVLLIQLHTLASFSAALGCCGPKNPSYCQCKQLSSIDETTCYYHKFNGSEPSVFSPRLVDYPLSGTHAEGAEVELVCSISYASSPTRCPLTVIWEHNGTVISSTTNSFDASNNLYHSTYKISEFSPADQGEYVCRVGEINSMAAIASPTASLQLPKFLGWVDEAHPPPNDPKNVYLTVSKEGSVLLECSPNTTESLEGTSPQVKFTAPVVILQSGNILVTRLKENTVITCEWPLVGRPTRYFHLTVSPDPIPGDLSLAVSPEDSVGNAGSNLELYCIPSHPVSGSITWFKDGMELVADDHIFIRGDGQVVEIIGAASSDAGNYTCSVSDGYQMVNESVTVTVIDPPGSVLISVIGNISDLTIDSNTNTVTVSPSRNATLLTSCQTNTSGPYHYYWLRGGVPIVEEEEGSKVLNLSVSDQLHGSTVSYQCVITNAAGRSLSQAIWIVKPKPNPPVNLRIRKNTTPGVYFQYDIIWGRPERGYGTTTTTSYTVETLSILDLITAEYCSCRDPESNVTDPMLAYHAGCFQRSDGRDYNLYYRVAANTMESQSPFVPGKTTSIKADPPPKAGDLRVTPYLAGNKMNLTLSWNYQYQNTASNYHTSCYDTEVTSPNISVPHEVRYEPDGKTFSVQVPWKCCTKFEWEVTNYNSIYRSRNSSTVDDYTSPPQSPTAPPRLVSVNRVGTTGTKFSLSFQIDPATSCMCGVKNGFEITVKTNDSSIKELTIPLSYDTLSFQSDFNLPEADCSAAYEISLDFNNSEGRSDFSSPITVGSPGESNIPSISTIGYSNTSWSSVTVDYKLEEGAECLLHQGALYFNICYALSQPNDSCSSELLDTEEEIECTKFNADKDGLVLPRYQNICVVARLWSDTLNMTLVTRSLTVSSDEGVPSTRPQLLNLTSANSTLTMTWSPITNDSWNGIPDRYIVNIYKLNGKLVNTINVLPYEAHSLALDGYDSSMDYNVSLSACTKIGCGPAASKVTDSILINANVLSITPSLTVSSSPPPSNQAEPDVKGTTNLNIIIGGAAAAVVFLVTTIIIIVAVSCISRNRLRKKKYDRLRDGSVPDITPSTLNGLFEEQPLITDREAPTGALAPSEYTEVESLYSENSRVVDWVNEAASHRDGYVKDADEELLAIQEEEEPTSNGSAPVIKPNEPPTQNLASCSGGYIENSGGSFRGNNNIVTAQSGGSGSDASTNTAVFSSGYSTVHSLSQASDVHMVPGHNGLQSAYTGIHNLTSGAGQYVPTQPSPLTTTRQTVDQESIDSIDFLQSLLCSEEFTNPGGHTTVSSSYRHSTPQPDTNHLTPFTHTTIPPPSPPSSHSEEENDSVFDTSMSPARHPVASKDQPGRTRSSATSGFLSLSNASLSSSENNMEMTSIHTHSNVHTTSRSPAPAQFSTTSPFKYHAPVIPSLLSSQPKTTHPVILPYFPAEESPSSCYENIDHDPLADDTIRFGL